MDSVILRNGMEDRISTSDVDEGDLLYDDNRLTLRDVVVLEQPDVEETVHLKEGFWKAFNRLSNSDADVIALLMMGYKFKDVSAMVYNARYRIRIAKKRFRRELEREEINV